MMMMMMMMMMMSHFVCVVCRPTYIRKLWNHICCWKF